MIYIEWLIYAFLGIGLFFNFLASLGLMRFPDVYTRLHAATKCTTFGSIFLSVAVMIYGAWKYHEGDTHMISLSVHTFIALVAIMLTNPTGAHAIARAAHRSGVKPAMAVVDDLEEKEEKNDDD